MRPAKKIAIAAIAAAFSTLCVVLSIYVPLIDASFLILASISLMLPLLKRDYVGGALSYICAGLLGFFIGGGNFVKMVPFWVFFGVHPLVLFLTSRFPKPLFWLKYALRIVFFQLALLLLYLLIQVVIVIFNYTFPYYLIAIGGTILFLAYDFLMDRIKNILDFYLNKWLNKK